MVSAAGDHEQRQLLPNAEAAVEAEPDPDGQLGDSEFDWRPGLRTLIDKELADLPADLEIEQVRDGFVVYGDGDALTLVRKTRALIVGTGGTWISGNFREPGTHWAKLKSALETRIERLRRSSSAASAKTRSSPKRSTAPPLRILSEFPGTLTGAMRQEALDASHRLAVERSLVFSHPVLIQTPAFAVQFAPLLGSPDLEQRFLLRHSEGWTFSGGLLLAPQRIPTPLAFRQAFTDERNVAVVWHAALTAYAELTCLAPEAVTSEPTERRRDVRGTSSGRGKRTDRRLTRRVGSVTFSAALVPSAETSAFLASYVAGHRRLLPAGQNASSDAERRAAAVGLFLRAGETWVQPHARGVPDDAVLRFTWTGGDRVE